MNYEFRVSPSFMMAAKALAKRYPSLKVDLNNLRQETYRKSISRR